jgi:beta-lactamase superfamily II metal-dependent hydrolase
MAPPTIAAPKGGHREALTLFVLGPGVGECQVLLLPDGRTMVVDACMQGKRNLTVELLRALGVSQVDLLVITHPDKDHVRGAAEVIRGFRPGKVWTFPTHNSLRALMARAKTMAKALNRPVTDALSDLTDLLTAVYQLPLAVREDVRGRRLSWSDPGYGYAVHPIAPANADEFAEAEWMLKQLALEHQGPRAQTDFVECIEQFLDGKRRAGDHPNHLSIALAIEYRARRLLLAGDVEVHRDPDRGWKGILRELDDASVRQSQIVESLSVIKVAHHGSKGAVHGPTWDRHVRSNASPFAIIAPYTPVPLPQQSGLRAIHSFGPTLAITETTPRARDAAKKARWRQLTTSKQPDDFPMVGVCLPPSGPVDFSVWGNASVWTA